MKVLLIYFIKAQKLNWNGKRNPPSKNSKKKWGMRSCKSKNVIILIITLSQVQKIPNLAYQIYQTLQIYWVYEKDYIKYKYDRKWKTENMAEKHNFQE